MTPSQYAQFYRSIATLIESGVSPKDAFSKIDEEEGSSEWSETVAMLNKGKPFHQALWASGRITRFEREIVALSEDAGRLQEALRYLADSHEARLLRVKTLKSRLIMPFAIIVVAILVSTLLAVVGHGESSLLHLLIKSAASLIVAYKLFGFALNWATAEASIVLSKLYYFSNKQWYKTLLQFTVFSALLWQIKSGLDFKSSFMRTAKLIDNKQLKRKLLAIASYCGNGKSVQESVRKVDLPLTADFAATLDSAEKTGSWNNSLGHILTLQKSELEGQLNHLMAWVPRFYYAVAVFISLFVIF